MTDPDLMELPPQYRCLYMMAKAEGRVLIDPSDERGVAACRALVEQKIFVEKDSPDPKGDSATVRALRFEIAGRYAAEGPT